MNTLNKGASVKIVDAGLKNKWRREWLEEKDVLKRPFSLWVRKIDAPGAAFCILCNQKLQYGSSGKKALATHSKHPDHLKLLDAQKLTQTVPGAQERLAPASQTDQIADLKAVLCSFVTENALSYNNRKRQASTYSSMDSWLQKDCSKKAR